jgi:hypothetical protein
LDCRVLGSVPEWHNICISQLWSFFYSLWDFSLCFVYLFINILL